MVLDQVGIPLGPLLASAGVVGLAIGFGAQSLVADYLSGLLIMVEDQCGVGDSVDLGEAVGEVEHGMGTRRPRRSRGLRRQPRHGPPRPGGHRPRPAPGPGLRGRTARGPGGVGRAVPGRRRGLVRLAVKTVPLSGASPASCAAG
ncbi:mechanosensitive ion channel family protein [Streptomyces mutabilis]|nr:mechanosensitive ion channel domain-containing protein [Streptomyces mutabilis]MCZ9352744.1 mechanosensitive ion channel family protein [Streptomyces mutabilis]